MTAFGIPMQSKIFNRKTARIFFVFLITVALILWIGIPVLMAVLWSLVNPDYPWSYPQLFPSHLSLAQWSYVFAFTNILRAMATSYSIAPVATLLPIIMPGMVIAQFLSRVFDFMGLAQTYPGLVLGHTLMGIPYMLRILTTSFENLPLEVMDAAENLGASQYVKFKEIIIPLILPGLFAGAIFTFITSLEEFNLTFVIGTPTLETIPTILFAFLGYQFVRTNAAVVSLILMVPNIIMLFIAERFLKTEYLSAAFGKM